MSLTKDGVTLVILIVFEAVFGLLGLLFSSQDNVVFRFAEGLAVGSSVLVFTAAVMLVVNSKIVRFK